MRKVLSILMTILLIANFLIPCSLAEDTSATNPPAAEIVEDTVKEEDEAGQEPAEPAVPEITEAPAAEATEAPEETAAPEATEAPVETAAPEATEAPDETAAPEATEVPSADPRLPELLLTDGDIQATSKDMSINIKFSTETAAVGETVTATWSVQGAYEPLLSVMTWWRWYNEDGTTAYTCLSEDKNSRSSSFTAPEGVRCRFYVDVIDSNGEESYSVSPFVSIQPMLLLSESSHELYMGQSFTLTPNITASSISDKSVSWHSSDDSVATVSAGGVVQAIAAGTATITVCSNENAAATADCLVTVKARTIQLNESSCTLDAGKKLQLKASLMPESESAQVVEWSSSNASIATVSKNGLVTGIAPGTAVITATVDGLSASCSFEILDDEATMPVPYIQDLGLSYTFMNGSFTRELEFEIGADLGVQPYSFTYYLYRNGYQIYTNTTTEAGVIGLTGAGLNYAGEYTVAVNVTDALGHSAFMKSGASIYLSNSGTTFTDDGTSRRRIYAKSLQIDANSAYMNVGTEQTLSANISPSNVSSRGLQWSSSNPAVATVSASGRVKAVSTGTTVITAMATDGSKVRNSLRITVRRMLTSIVPAQTEIQMYTGATRKISTTLAPADATIKKLDYSSDAPEIVSVDESGKLTAHKAGSAVIKITAQDMGGAEAEVHVTVLQLWNPSPMFERPRCLSATR